MALVRQREWIFPERIEDIKDVDTYLHKHYEQHYEESIARLADFESLEIDTQIVTDWTIITSFKPSADATVDLGAVGATDYRFRHLYLSGNLSDETNTLTVANAKTAYDHSQDSSQAHSDYLKNDANDTTSGDLTIQTALLLTANARVKAIAGTNDSLVLDGKGTGTVYFNYDDGTGGVIFSDGAGGNKASITSAGLLTIAGNFTLTSATSTITGGTALNVEAGANGIISTTIRDDTTVSAAT